MLLAVWLVGVFVLVGVLWVVATRIVPTDSTQLRHLAALEKGEEFEVEGPRFYCQMCKTYTSTHKLRQTRMCSTARSAAGA